MNETKKEFLMTVGFSIFVGCFSLFLWLGSKHDIQYWAANVVLFAYPSSVVGIFLIRIYNYAVKLGDMGLDPVPRKA